jgi:hypothetical protein
MNSQSGAGACSRSNEDSSAAQMGVSDPIYDLSRGYRMVGYISV